MTYQEAIRYLESFIDYEKAGYCDYNISFRLERVRKLLSRLKDPHLGIRSIHIAGTKGKGSTASFIQSILKESGYKAGLYTSPHLVSFRERIRIDDKLISEQDVADITDSFRPVLDNMDKEEKPTFFEVYTAIAHVYFKSENADFAVYETGLGGRMDATNVLEPLVTAITPISYDHTNILGNTLTKIAGEKAGIIKQGVPCISALQEDESLEVIKTVCKKKNSPLITVGDDIRFEEKESSDKGSVFDVVSPVRRYDSLETGLLGSYQLINAATAIGIAETLGKNDVNISADAIRKGVRNAKWDGRLQILGRHPYIVVDGAHNRASAKALASAIKKIFSHRRIVLVIGLSRDKDFEGVLSEILTIADSVITTKADVPGRAMEPELIREHVLRIDVSKPKDISIACSVAEAIRLAVKKAGPEDMILVTGSLFVVGETIALAKEEKMYG